MYNSLRKAEIGAPYTTGETMDYTLLTKVGTLLKDPKAVEIIEKYVPGIAKNPMLALAKGMTLKAILDFPQAKQAGLTKEILEKVLGEINKSKE